ncbi:MAG: hypothetical protein RLZ81_1088 [Pseudomonadota bacterium]
MAQWAECRLLTGRSPTRAYLLELARRAGLRTRQATASIGRLCEGMGALDDLAKDLPIRKTRLAALRNVLA